MSQRFVHIAVLDIVASAIVMFVYAEVMMPGFKNPFRRPKIQHPDGLDSTYYTAGFVFDGGAEHLAYHNDRPHPLLTKYAGFLTRRQLRVTNQQTIYQYAGAPLQPLLQGVVAGQVTTASLLQNGTLSGNPNNVALNNSLFGGVQ
jgi:hypothetical protein